jgi:hypothetical protein
LPTEIGGIKDTQGCEEIAAEGQDLLSPKEGGRDKLRVWHQLPPTSLAKQQEKKHLAIAS